MRDEYKRPATKLSPAAAFYLESIKRKLKENDAKKMEKMVKKK